MLSEKMFLVRLLRAKTSVAEQMEGVMGVGGVGVYGEAEAEVHLAVGPEV